MIKLLCKVPRKVTVAVSGGVDSMAALNFLKRNHDVTAAFFNHGTKTSAVAKDVVETSCRIHGIPLIMGSIQRERNKDESLEEYWRNERYAWLENLDDTVVTAHTLDDAVETWVWSSMHGESRLPAIERDNIIRPFLTTPKSEFERWADDYLVAWAYDHSNDDTRFTRNYIRHVMMPHVLRVNPGIRKMVKKRLTHLVKAL